MAEMLVPELCVVDNALEGTVKLAIDVLVPLYTAIPFVTLKLLINPLR